MTPGTLGPTFHDFDRVSRSPSSACTASPPAAASFRSLCTFRACRSVKSAPSELTRLLPFDVKASHSARGFDIRMQSRQESAPRPFSFLLVRCHIPHRHPRFGFWGAGLNASGTEPKLSLSPCNKQPKTNRSNSQEQNSSASQAAIPNSHKGDTLPIPAVCNRVNCVQTGFT